MAFTAAKEGMCTKCAKPIVIGEMISWSRTAGGAWHSACAPQPMAPAIPIENKRMGRIETALASLKQAVESAPAAEIDEERLRMAITDELLNMAPTSETCKMLENLAASVTHGLLRDWKGDQALLKTLAAQAVDERLPRKLIVNTEKQEPVTFETAHESLPTLIKLANTRNLSGHRLNIYMHGPAGSGKSSAARQMAEALGLPFGYASLNPMTSDSRAIGFMHAGGQYVSTEFTERYEHGGVFCWDEVDNASAAFTTTLNSALENGHGAFPHRVIPRHKDFICVSTANTIGRGGDIHYPERRALDGAFLDRFIFLEWGYDQKLTRAILAAILGGENVDELIQWVDDKAAGYKARFPDLIVSPRAYIQSALLQAQGFPKKIIEQGAVSRGLTC